MANWLANNAAFQVNFKNFFYWNEVAKSFFEAVNGNAVTSSSQHFFVLLQLILWIRIHGPEGMKRVGILTWVDIKLCHWVPKVPFWYEKYRFYSCIFLSEI